ncbi:hypothetical protein Kpol_1045p21 [Vanderwaltozyma polyspora DSM 70294]|uniref:High osmolarity signaling protein SHO1 n=1 Tax=Vanderwaltozyma polyspora (strain ATCC 22028 / DSM 70294 / BCRC 21397 / CBS 2163 / NBRC 10782 / NRRL Y-8283 / UCD 57-17) TaxID=436907 RepID=SHO1_VANPO|nr:uncharacterized protein Kpol_1045p21 [Vanderwaltozyma polyspora DSM 70294]A7TI28.1 RecName: Full=High osmolarity signaling protein SHO1; AltName: Full=Osmosensor SHO1 [Vanderwaltozyma polyspora DSM 70294]EDO18035.1 hypothetical protein Kpol_1045p21 [Vanderwaltozyma polyspora DSM 70294]
MIPSRANAKARRAGHHVRHSFGISNLVGDPFAISTISISMISWVITLGGSIASATDRESFPRFTWWGIAYQALLLFIMIVIYCYDLVDYYKGFISSGSGVAFIYNTNSATNLVYSNGARKAAASAGVILLSVINLIWVFYYGGDNASPTNRWIDSFSLRGIRPSAYEDALIRSLRRRSAVHSRNLQNAALERENLHLSTNLYNGVDQNQNYVSAVGLTGFENTNPNSTNSNFNSPYRDQQNDEVISMQIRNPTDTLKTSNENVNTFVTESSNGNTETTMGDTLGLYSEFGDESFPYTARALYSYQADDADGYEVSFEQGEILKVSDIEGRWWKSKKETGEVGIIPSNYVQLIEDDEGI